MVRKEGEHLTVEYVIRNFRKSVKSMKGEIKKALRANETVKADNLAMMGELWEQSRHIIQNGKSERIVGLPPLRTREKSCLITELDNVEESKEGISPTLSDQISEIKASSARKMTSTSLSTSQILRGVKTR